MPEQPRYGFAQHVNAGYQDGRGDLSPGLEAQNAAFNAKVEQATARGTGEVSQAPTSVLQAHELSANGMSSQLAENRAIGGQVLGSGNGMSTETQEPYQTNRLLGGAG